MIRAIIVDDEFDARESLRLLLEKYCPEIDIIAQAASVDEGLRCIAVEKPDLVFLDIHMPGKSGFNLLEALGNFDFEVIFVTAHDQYAIKAIRFSALDYLLKPVDIDELLAAVNKVSQRKSQKGLQFHFEALLNNMPFSSRKTNKLAIPTMEGVIFQPIEEIIYLKADRNYTTIHQVEMKSLLVSKPLKDFEHMLSEFGFYRIHHACLINLDHIIKYVKGEGGYVIMTDNHHLDVSRRKKDGFLHQLNKI